MKVEDIYTIGANESDSPVGEDTLSQYELSILQDDSPESAKWSSKSGSTTASEKCC